MGIRFDSAVIMTEDVDTMKEFYSTVMKQSIKHDFGACVIFECGLSVWKPVSGHTLLQALGSRRAQGNGSLELCFDTEDFEKDIAEVKRSGVKLVHDVSEEQWGQLTIRFYDPDGNAVELGESIPAFCRRLYALGMSAEQVSEKTGVPVNLVKEYVK